MKRNVTAAISVFAAATLTLAACGGDNGSDDDGGDGGPVTLTLTANSIVGGKSTAEAEWIEDWLIPEFEAHMEAEGHDVTVEFEGQGVDDEEYKTKIALDLQSGGGADVMGIDGIWVGEFAEAGYIEPLEDVGGDAVNDWEGWDQIPDAVQNALAFEDQRYGIPQGADGRVLFYNRDLFDQAGLDTEWQPTSWEDVLDAARAVNDLDGVLGIQLNAGTAMGEATTMQGLLPMLVGTGAEVWTDGQWLGGGEALTQVLDLYETIYVTEDLGDPILQQEAAGRDTSFELFAAGEIGILLEGDYFWRSVVDPDVGIAPMEDRDDVVGYAMIPAIEPGAGIDGQDFVSMSGGTGRVLNPASENPELAWELLAFMNSAEAYHARAEEGLNITPREDVNSELLSGEPMLTYVSDEVLPITAYRPGLADYPQVSVAYQEATEAVVTGTSVDDAVSSFHDSLVGVVGEDSVAGG